MKSKWKEMEWGPLGGERRGVMLFPCCPANIRIRLHLKEFVNFSKSNPCGDQQQRGAEARGPRCAPRREMNVAQGCARAPQHQRPGLPVWEGQVGAPRPAGHRLHTAGPSAEPTPC